MWTSLSLCSLTLARPDPLFQAALPQDAHQIETMGNKGIGSLAIEYAKEGIRFNAVAPGVVDTPMHKDDPEDSLKKSNPMGKITNVKDIVDAVIFLAQAGQVTGEVLHVDGGSHAGRW